MSINDGDGRSPGELPVLAASFADERSLWRAVRAIEERGVGRDFIGVLIAGGDGASSGAGAPCVLSVLAPRRRHAALIEALENCGATRAGAARAIREACGALPHPGCVEDRGLKAPMGLDYPENRSRSRGSKGADRP